MPSYVLEPGKRIQDWDYDFTWTKDHIPPDQLRPLIFTHDTLADAALDRLSIFLPSSSPLRGVSSSSSSKVKEKCPLTSQPDLYSLLQTHYPKDPVLSELWTQIHIIPPWVSWPAIARGQEVFYRYAGPSIISLTFHSLLGGLGSPRIVETLSRTGGFSVAKNRRRLLETFQMVLSVTSSLASLQPGGEGFASTIRVRLLHASVRRRILALTSSRPEYYSVDKNGIPINDLDSIATVTAFSSNLVWLGYPRQGIFLSDPEIENLLALWRYVAYLLGTPHEPFDSPRSAKLWMESLLVSELDPSPTSCRLADNMLQAFANQPPTYPSLPFLQAQARWLNGDKLSDALKIPTPKFWYQWLVAAQCCYFIVLCGLKQRIRWLDQVLNAHMKRLLREKTLELYEGQKARFEFQYVPSWAQLLNTTEEEEGKEDKGARKEKNGSGGVGWTVGSEQRNLVVLLVIMGLGGLAAWAGVRSVVSVLA